ncbi:MAG TPA: M23 family metallopeptidase [Longimicrobiales bacterium]|nr:M23 family metallopeptidase [Longimicrobiales bacterium]
MLFVLALGGSACEPLGDLREHISPTASAHEAYAHGLERSGLAFTALGQDWLRVANDALAHPVPATLPLQEEGYFAPERPGAVAYRISLLRGQRVSVHATLRPDASARLFVDIFTPQDTIRAAERLASADSQATSLEFEPRRAGDFVIRVQPELLRGGRYTLIVRAAPSLAFPVSGAGRRNVQSLFGAARDGGSRAHHGIDIFAPRGTPVLAATTGRVARVQETAVGGRVVWLRDERRGQSLYYAHLDSQHVAAGVMVRPGDTLGTVGNSGNARSTPPHLHFGIYRRGEGPIDPLPFVHVADTVPRVPAGDTAALGALVRASRATTVRNAPRAEAPGLAELEGRDLVRALGAVGSWYRVELPDGRSGFLPAGVLGVARTPLWQQRSPAGLELRDAPRPNAGLIMRLAEGQELRVLGTYGRYAYVAVDTLHGWVSASTAPP